MKTLRDLKAQIGRPKSLGGDIRKVFSVTYSVHNKLASRYKWYDNWHHKPYASRVHYGLLSLVLIISVAFTALAAGQIIHTPVNEQKARAATACSSAATGAWASATTWAAPCDVAGGPTASNDVTIITGTVVTVGANAAANTITINDSATANGLTISSTYTLTVTTDVTFAANTTGNNQTISLGGSGILNIGGNLNMNNVPTGAGSPLVVTAIDTCTSCQLNVTGATNMTNATSAVAGAAKITMTTGATNIFSTGSLAINGDTTGTGITTVSSLTGTITLNGAATFTGVAGKTLLTTTGAGNINLNNGSIGTGGTLTLTAATTLTSTGTSAVNLGSLNWGVLTLTSGTLTLGAASTFTDVTLTSGTLTLGANLSISGNWTNNSGTGALTGNYTVAMGGTVSKNIGTGADYATTFYALNFANRAVRVAMTSFTVTTTMTFLASGTGAQSLTLNSSSVVLTVDAVTMNQPTGAFTSALNINAGTVNASGTVYLKGNNSTITRISKIAITTGTLTMTNAASLLIESTYPQQKIISISSTGTINIAGSINPAWKATSDPGTTSTWNFNGTAAQTIPMGAGGSTPWGICTTQCYANLKIMNTEATTGASLGNPVASGNISGDVTVGDDVVSAVFTDPVATFVGAGTKTLLVNGNSTFNMTASAAYPTGFATFTYDPTSTVNYEQTTNPLTVTAPAAGYGNLGMMAATSATQNFPASALTIAGNLTIGDGTASVTTAVADGANGINVGGNWLVQANSLFTHSNGAVTLNGGAIQTVTANAQPFYDLTVTNASVAGVTFADDCTVAGTFIDITPSSKLTFHAGSTYTFANIDINGQAVGTRIVMQSSSTPSYWLFNVTQLTPAPAYVNATDSDASGGNTIIPTNSIGSHTLNWQFNSSPVNDSLTFSNPYSGTANTAVADDTTEWNFQAKVTDADGPTDMNYIEIRFANSTDSTLPYDSLKYRWTRSSNIFSEEADTQSAGTIAVDSSAVAVGNQWTVDFKIKISSSFSAKDTDYNIELYSIDNSAASDNDDYTNIYRVTDLSLTFNVDSNSLDFTSLLPGEIRTKTTEATVSTNYPNGYSLYLRDDIVGGDSALLHQVDLATRIADSLGTYDTPVAWSGSGLGICVYQATNKEGKWGTGISEMDVSNLYAGIPETNGATSIHTKAGSPTSNDLTKIGYKLVVPDSQKTGAYSGIVTYTATGALN